MSLFILSEYDKKKLERLGKQQETVSSLKKLFLNTATKGTIPPDVQTLAAERIAIDIIHDVFLSLIHI